MVMLQVSKLNTFNENMHHSGFLRSMESMEKYGIWFYNFPDLEKYGKLKLLYRKIFMFPRLLSLFYFLKKKERKKKNIKQREMHRSVGSDEQHYLAIIFWKLFSDIFRINIQLNSIIYLHDSLYTQMSEIIWCFCLEVWKFGYGKSMEFWNVKYVGTL